MNTTIVCTNCKAVNPATNLYCQSCGAQLATATVPSTPVPPPFAQPSQPGAVPPPAYPPQQAPYAQPPAMGYQPPMPMFIPPAIEKLGVKVDEFSDLIPDLGEEAAKVEEVFIKAIGEKNLPGVNIAKSVYSAGGRQRDYVGITHPAGATMLVGIKALGKDLATNWYLYTKRTINWLTVGIVGGAAFFLALLTFIFGLVTIWGFSTAWSQFFNTLALLLIAGIFVTGLLGKILKDDISALFVKEMDDIAWEDVGVMQSVVHDALIDTIDEALYEPVTEPEPVKKTKKSK